MNKDVDAEQIGGSHYKKGGDVLQHWNLVAIHNWDYFQAQIIKYVMRWKDKDGAKDLQKAKHFLDKYISLVSEGKIKGNGAEPTRGYVNQDPDK